MIKPDEKLVNEVPLCSFDTVIKAVEDEINAGHIRKVFQLDLGYALYDDPEYTKPVGAAGHYYAVPAWRLNCLYVPNAKKELPERDADVFECDTLESATILVNAQTGAMLDFMRTDKQRAAYPGFISWDVVDTT